jgi:hypothetical protein
MKHATLGNKGALGLHMTRQIRQTVLLGELYGNDPWNPDLSSEWIYNIEPEKLLHILFPSSLPHGTEMLKTEQGHKFS